MKALILGVLIFSSASYFGCSSKENPTKAKHAENNPQEGVNVSSAKIEELSPEEAKERLRGRGLGYAFGLSLNDVPEVNAINRNGHSPLYDAAAYKSAEVVSLLLKAGAEVDFQHSKTGETALIRAVKYGKKDAVQALIDGKANFRIKDGLGYTALWYADNLARKDIAQILRQAGASE